MSEPIKLVNDEYFLVETLGRWEVIDCEGGHIDYLPRAWDVERVNHWLEGWLAGNARGQTWGENYGGTRARREMLKALGIEEELRALRVDIRCLALTLYYHDGVCKEDVAALAGRCDG